MLTFAALTNMALRDLGYDTDYVTYILEEMQVNDVQKRAFLFYTLMYCVDFMGEPLVDDGEQRLLTKLKRDITGKE